METMLYGGLALLGASVLLLMIEAFVPSGGLIGAVSVICAVAGVVLLFNHSVGWGVSGMLGIMVLGPAGFFGAMNLLPETPFGQRLIGAPSAEEVEQSVSRERALIDARTALIGAEGVTCSVCRPVGEAIIDGERYEVHAEGEMLDVGTPVRVVGAGLREIRVRPIG